MDVDILLIYLVENAKEVEWSFWSGSESCICTDEGVVPKLSLVDMVERSHLLIG